MRDNSHVTPSGKMFALVVSGTGNTWDTLPDFDLSYKFRVLVDVADNFFLVY